MLVATESAIKKIKQQIQKRGKGLGIRIGVKTTGCSGLAYVLEYVNKYTAEPGCINYSQPEFVVIVDQRHDVYLRGMIIDYVRQGLNEGFEFRNPNERDRCGCGSSFRI